MNAPCLNREFLNIIVFLKKKNSIEFFKIINFFESRNSKIGDYPYTFKNIKKYLTADPHLWNGRSLFNKNCERRG